jgi:hypothetical protein
VDYFFQIFIHIYCRFPESDKPLDQETLDWFSYLVSISEGYDLNKKIISWSHYLDLQDEHSVTSYPKEILSNLQTIQSYP